MSWWDFFRGRSFNARDTEYLTRLYGGDVWAGEAVNVQTAMQLSAYWGCVRLVSQVIATMPLDFYRRETNGDKTPAPEHPLADLLKSSPNSEQTAVEFWEGRTASLCITGNGFAEIVRSGPRIVALEHMPPDTGVRRLDNGDLEYRYSYNGKETVLSEKNVFHIRGFGYDGCLGLSPLSYARQTLGTSIATERATANVFSKNMRARGFFTSPTVLDGEQRKQVRESLIDPFTGPNAKDWGILEAGFDFKTISIPPKDAEMLLSRKFNVEDVCRWFGVPPIMVGHSSEGQTMWGSGVEQIFINWHKIGLLPYLERIEQRISKSLLTPADRAAGYFAEFNADGLLRGDSQARGEFYSKLAQVAGISPAEIRRKENFRAKPGTDVLLVNSTMTPLELAGQKPAAPTPPATEPNPAKENQQ